MHVSLTFNPPRLGLFILGVNQMFDASKITKENWEGFNPYRKRPFRVYAVQINLPEGFFVNTLEGVMKGKKGDYLLIGIDGEKYICKKSIFEKTYKSDVYVKKNIFCKK
jgi:hypothetical protein